LTLLVYPGWNVGEYFAPDGAVTRTAEQVDGGAQLEMRPDGVLEMGLTAPGDTSADVPRAVLDWLLATPRRGGEQAPIHFRLEANPNALAKPLHPDDGGPGPVVTGMLTALPEAAKEYQRRGGCVTIVTKPWTHGVDDPWFYINSQYPVTGR